MSRPVSVLAGTVLVLASLLLASCGHGGDAGSQGPAPAGGAGGGADAPPGAVHAAWTDDHTSLTTPAFVTGRVDLPAPDAASGPVTLVDVRLHGAGFFAVPRQCVPSATLQRESGIVGGDHLICVPAAGATGIDFRALTRPVAGGPTDGPTDGATSGASDLSLSADVEVTSAGGTATTTLPARSVAPGAHGTTGVEPTLRLLSSPDFLNADVGDLRHGEATWDPSVSTNSTNADYRHAMAAVLDDWESLHPAAVLVAGDLVDGRWGFDSQHTGVFGPVDTLAHRREAVRRAARTYYPQWKNRFTQHHLAVFPAPGDHDYGDNPWPHTKRQLTSTFRHEFAREFTRDAAGHPLFASHPRGPAGLTAYAGRPTPDVQVVSLDVFDITPARARIRVDRLQMRWLAHVLAKARRDGVRWIVVQGHVPIVWPVPTLASSGLHYPGGTHSRLWQLMEKYHVNLYLCGEVHDTTTSERGGVTQITHGGAFQYGLTTALVLDFYRHQAYLTLRDYDVRHHVTKAPRLWETRRKGIPPYIRVVGPPSVIGTAVLKPGGLAESSGILVPRH